MDLLLYRSSNSSHGVSSREGDKPRAYYTKWSNSEREKQISHINAHIWTLEKWYWWTYFQGRNGDADIENRLLDTVGEEESGTSRESSIDKYTLSCVKQIAGEKLLYNRKPTQARDDDLEGWNRGVEEGSKGRCYVHNYDWFALCGRNYHNIVKQFSSN